MFLQQRSYLFLLVCCSLHRCSWGFLLSIPHEARDRSPRWLRARSRSRTERTSPFWASARGGGGRGKPPPLAVGADAGEEVAAGPRAAAESAHLKLRSLGQGNKPAPAAAMATAERPWKWIVVFEDGREEDVTEVVSMARQSGAGAADSPVDGVPGAEETGGGDPPSNAEGAREHESDGSAAASPAGKARLLKYRAPRGAEGETGGETRYACLGDDVSKFIVFLESAVARGEGNYCDDGAGGADLDGVGGGGAVAGGAERRITVSTVEVRDEGVQQRLRALWKEGRLLSQERDAANVLRGQEQNFSELLASYTNRTKSNHWEEIPAERLLDTLEAGFGEGARSACAYDPARPVGETLSSVKAVLEWFRKDFPYYYDGCHACGNSENNTFVGYVSPTEGEREFRAGRTEVYHCSSCGSVSRFARYVAVSKVLDTHRGRCGEYSVLMMRLLEALGYTCRWVVDWSDHVWVEARVGGSWVHIDPCEAAVGEPLLYESWGKKQTYILAFTPTEVVDVTENYTSDYEAAKSRRDIDQDTMARLLAEATETLRGA